MTKEELKQIYYLNKEIKMWQRELDKLECKSLIKGQEITGMPFGTGITDKVADLAVAKAEYKKIIEGKLAEIQVQRVKIISYIDSIQDSQLRQIMFFRNVSCMSWNQIASEIGGYNSSDCIRKMYDRHFE